MHPRKIYPCVVLAALLAGGCGKEPEPVAGSPSPAQAQGAAAAPAKPAAEPAAKPAVEASAKQVVKTSASNPALPREPQSAGAQASKTPASPPGKGTRPSGGPAPLPAGAGAGTDASAKTQMPAADKKGFLVEVSGHRAMAEGAGPGGRGAEVEVVLRNFGEEPLASATIIARLRTPDANYRYPTRKMLKNVPAGGGSQKTAFEVQTIKALSGPAALIFEARVPDRGRSNAAVYEFDAATLLPVGEGDPFSAGLKPQASGMSRFEAGETMPDFAFPDLDGKKVSLSGLGGKTYLVFVCATWSPHCNKLPESTNAWNAKYEGKGLRIVEVFFDDPVKVKAFVEKKALSNVVLLATQKEVEDLFRMKAFPVFYLLSADRVVQWRRDGFKDELRIEFEVEQALEDAMH